MENKTSKKIDAIYDYIVLNSACDKMMSRTEFIYNIYYLNLLIFKLYKIYKNKKTSRSQKLQLILDLENSEGNKFLDKKTAVEILDVHAPKIYLLYERLYKLRREAVKNKQNNLMEGGNIVGDILVNGGETIKSFGLKMNNQKLVYIWFWIYGIN